MNVFDIRRKEKNRLSTDFHWTIRDARGLSCLGQKVRMEQIQKSLWWGCVLVSYWCVTNYQTHLWSCWQEFFKGSSSSSCCWRWCMWNSWWWTGRPACCNSWGCKESDMTEQLNWTALLIQNVILQMWLHTPGYPALVSDHTILVTWVIKDFLV